MKGKFEIVDSEVLFENLTKFKNTSEKWGVLKRDVKFGIIPAYSLLIEPTFNEIIYNTDLEVIEAIRHDTQIGGYVQTNRMYFDKNGKQVWQSVDGEICGVDQVKNIFVRKDKKVGLLDRNFNLLIAPKYEQLTAINDKMYKASLNGKFGVVDRNDARILDVVWNEITITSDQKAFVKKDDIYFSFDLLDHTLKTLAFEKILNASSNTYAAPSAESLKYYKSVTDVKENPNFDEYALEMVRYNGKWGVIDGNGKVIIPNDYCFVDFLRNPKYFKVGIGALEVTDFEDEDGYTKISIQQVKWGIVDINNKIVVPIEFDWIDEVESTIWVVYKGGTVFYNDDYQEDYWTTKNGKLGVYNLNKPIVPIEYDSIRKTWFRIKDYIFVQKGIPFFDENAAEYDVYTLDGKKIEKNKPNPNHHNNGG